jgi:hypothetical protein
VRQSVSENRLPLSMVLRLMAEHVEGGWGTLPRRAPGNSTRRPATEPGPGRPPSPMLRRATTLPRLSGLSPANSGHSASSSRCGVTA